MSAVNKQPLDTRTREEIRVLAAAIMWWRELANKPSTDVLWEALDAMLLPRQQHGEGKRGKRARKN